MAIKRTLQQNCLACGKQQVRRRGDWLHYNECPCNPPPGPPTPPVRFRFSEVLLSGGVAAEDLPDEGTLSGNPLHDVRLTRDDAEIVADCVTEVEARLRVEALRFEQLARSAHGPETRAGLYSDATRRRRHADMLGVLATKLLHWKR